MTKADSPSPALSVSEAEALTADIYELTVTATPGTSERDQNFALLDSQGRRYLLKISNAEERIEAVSFENGALKHIRSVAPDLPSPEIMPTAEGLESGSIRNREGRTCIVRLMSWLDGQMLRRVQLTSALRQELGTKLAHLDRALRGYFHPAANKKILWDLRAFPTLKPQLPHVSDRDLREECALLLKEFETRVAPHLSSLRAQVNHNDLNPSNVLVSTQAPHHITGILDFGDMIYGPLICNIAIAASYQLSEGDDPLAGALEFVQAYHAINPLEEQELDLLYDLIRARLASTLIITAWRAHLHPSNSEYLLRNAPAAAKHLRALQPGCPDLARDRFKALSAAPAVAADQVIASGNLVQRRQALLGDAYRLFYDRPAHITRARGVWLYDESDQRLLDAYNNVALVGHCHPDVVRALSTQAQLLNTHTRYLHGGIVQYAEALTALFPTALKQVMFSCTGSEANELAVRAARAYTGNRGVIVSSHAYHGNTSTISQLSPSYANADAPARWAAFAPPPRRHSDESESDAAARFVAGIQSAIDTLEQRGIQPAALLLDVAFTSDGMYIPPPGAVSEAVALVRNAGGVFIADEVQSGFARTGASMWGFERHNVVPEIVTLGKSIGNGHPLAATLFQPEVLDAFSSRARYFNTFGGNPVSAAVGLAVLNVFQRDQLAANSKTTGAYLHDRLNALKKQYPLISQIRGDGLFAGVELRHTGDDASSATDAASRIVNRMRNLGVLISMIGPNANVLKIRPPLPFRPRHVDQLITALDVSLRQTSQENAHEQSA